MIARLIKASVHHRGLVVLLTLFVIAGGVWSVFRIKIDAIPDLSDVQVVLRTEYPGQAPEIVEDQVTYPLTTAMLAVPYAKVVRGYSMFGSSFVYIIFEDGTDMYWARSRVLEQLNFVASVLPNNVSPQLGPDATGVGWVFEYVLTTGKYCPTHPNGLWHDPVNDAWFAERSEAGEAKEVQDRLIHHRVFPDAKVFYADRVENRRYDSPDDAPADVRDRLEPIELVRGYDTCPLDGTPLLPSQQDLSDLRGLQDWYLRYELMAVNGVSEVAALGGFVKQYQVVVDPVKLLAYRLPLQKVKMAVQRSNVDVGGRVIEMSETEYMVRGLGYLGSLTDQEIEAARQAGTSAEEARSKRAMEELRKIALGADEEGTPIYLRDVAEIRIGPEIRRGIADWKGEGETVAGIIIMRFGENARTTIERVRERLAELETGLPPGVAIEVGYDRSDLIERAMDTLIHTLIEEIIVVSLVCLLFLVHARSALVAIFVLPTGVLMTLAIMFALDLNANIMSLGGIAIAIGVMVDSAIIMVENAHKHLEMERHRVQQGQPPRPRLDIVTEAAAEVGPSLFFALLIAVVSFTSIFMLGGQSGRLFKPLAATNIFALTCGAVLAVTIIPILMAYFISEQVVPKRIAPVKRALVYVAVIIFPAIVLAFAPLPHLQPWRWWLVIGWVVASALVILPQKILDERRNPISRFLEFVYNPAFALVMRFRWLTLSIALVLIGWVVLFLLQVMFSADIYRRIPVLAAIVPTLGSEFMPPLEEGDLLYMPTTDPGISAMKARELLQQTDKLIMQFPEVQTVFGKIGRAETATDPAPLTMVETTIMLERDKSKWRQVPIDRFWLHWPGFTHPLLRGLFPRTRPITVDELVYGYEWPDGPHVPGLNEVIQIPGLTNAWTMPIKTRIDMLSTGIKTPVGIKVMGPDLATLAEISAQIAQVVKTAEGVGVFTTSAFPEKSVGGNYLDIKIDRDQIARYALTIGDVQDVIMSALGGMNVTYTVEGLERYPVNVRYPHELRDNLPALRRTLVATPTGTQVPLGQLATISIHKGPPMVKSENARLTSWVYVDIAGIDVGTYVRSAQKAVEQAVELPPGYTIIWSGQYEYMQAARARLMIAVPMALVLIILLLYMATMSWLRVAIVILTLPFSLVGAISLLRFLEYNLSLAVWVGVIALAGLAVETGIVMLLYLDTSFERFRAEGRMRNTDDLWHAVHDGAVKRIRPKTMTVCAIFAGLLPLMWASGAGADTMRRLAVPMIGGVATSFILELLIFPVIFYIAMRIAMRREFHRFSQTTQSFESTV